MGKRSLAILAFILFLLGPALAQETSIPYVSAETLKELQNGTELRRSVGPGREPQLLPAIPWSERILRETASLGPTIGTEVLILRSSNPAELDSGPALLKLYNLLRSVSRMKGIEYYSMSRKRMRTLFVESYAVDDPLTLKRLPDPLVDEIPPSSFLYILQKDLNFGKNVYKSEYLHEGGILALRNENLTPMRYLGMTLVAPTQSLTWLVLIPYEGNLLFYGLSCARTASFFGLEKKAENSFYNRLKAIYGWFASEVEKTF
jgi:hypothetical protein